MTAPISTAPTSVARVRRRQLAWLWIGFAVAVGIAAVMVFRLYAAFERELLEQQRLIVDAQRRDARQRIAAEIETLRDAALKRLVSLHAEGLGYALERWDDSDPRIVGVFQWEAGQYLAGARLPPGVDETALARGWMEAEDASGSGPSRPFATEAIPTVNNPRYPSGSFGYQEENMEIHAHAGGDVRPLAGWEAPLAPGLPWVIWYRVGPRAPVRGCLIAVAPVLARLRAEFAREPAVEIEIRANQFPHLPDAAPTDSLLASGLPGYALVVRPGRLFSDKLLNAQLGALAVALLLGTVVLGVWALWWMSRRAIREAELKTTFVAQVSHELRTPLTSIQMFADMLAAPDLPAEKRLKFAGTIGRESARLGALIERLLAFNALEQGKLAVTIESVDVAALVRETLDEMDAALRAGGLAPELGPLPAPLRAATDRSAFKQALLNLLENALKYARDGRWLRISAAAEGATARVRVEDHGPGVPPALGERVFEPFVQGGHSLVDKHPGIGLGLSIARGGLRQAGGDLVLLPSPAGAVFEIRVPLATSS